MQGVNIRVSPVRGCDGTLLFCKFELWVEVEQQVLCSSITPTGAVVSAAKILWQRGHDIATPLTLTDHESEEIVFDGTIGDAMKARTVPEAANDNLPFRSVSGD